MLLRPSLLEGLTFIDTTINLPGPVAGWILTRLGAEVIKVDPPEGDPLSRYPSLDQAINGVKKRVVIDLRTPDGAADLKARCTRADGILVGMRPSTLGRLGLSPEVLSAINPRLVYCHVTGYAKDSADADTPGHDLNYLAATGLLALLFPHFRLPTQLADLSGALYAVIGLLAAVIERTRTGRGPEIEVNLADSAGLFGLVPSFSPELADILSGSRVAYHVYSTADGQLAVGALEPKFFRNLCEALGHPEWAEAGLSPAAPGNPVYDGLADIFQGRSATDWGQWAKSRGLPLTAVNPFSPKRLNGWPLRIQEPPD